MDRRTAKRAVATIATALTMSLGGVAFTASPALAYPSGCNAVTDGPQGGEANCTGGTGQFRVYVVCEGWVQTFRNYGPWRIPGQGLTSRAACDGIFSSRQSVGYNTIGPIG